MLHYLDRVGGRSNTPTKAPISSAHLSFGRWVDKVPPASLLISSSTLRYLDQVGGRSNNVVLVEGFRYRASFQEGNRYCTRTFEEIRRDSNDCERHITFIVSNAQDICETGVRCDVFMDVSEKYRNY